MTDYPLRREFKKYENMHVVISGPLLAINNAMLSFIPFTVLPTPKVSVRHLRIPTTDNERIPAVLYEPKSMMKNAPCLIYFHGGGFILKASAYQYIMARQYAERTPCKVLFVDYRLAPKYVFPIPEEDAFASLDWVLNNAEILGIDRERIAVGGDSAGGNIAAALTLMSRDFLNFKPTLQMLIYPATDRRMNTRSMRVYTDTPVWDAIRTAKMWKMYLPKKYINSPYLQYASPLEAPSHEDLPDAYIETAQFDCLHDEGIEYARALEHAGSVVELVDTRGTMHGYDMAELSPLVRDCMNKRVRALQRSFGLEPERKRRGVIKRSGTLRTRKPIFSRLRAAADSTPRSATEEMVLDSDYVIYNADQTVS